MRVICAPDSFKESLAAPDVAGAMARGVRRVLPDAEVDLCPIADGGEGTVEALVSATGGSIRRVRVSGPLGEPVEAPWGLLGDARTAVVEMAAASGLALVPPAQRDPRRTTTRGTGELLHAALDAGASRIILGIGGSGTTDGGAGAAQALGVRFCAGDREIREPLAGGLLQSVTRIDLARRDPRLAAVDLLIACDVTNPLTGPDGAAAVYGPQKGATPEQVEQLDQALAHLAAITRLSIGRDLQHTPGAGAAGGLGFGALAFLGGTLRRGIDLVLEAVRFSERVAGCDFCLTGEGRMDAQTVQGKAIAGVATAAKARGVPTLAIVGSVGPGVEKVREVGVTDWSAVGEGLPLEESMTRAAELIEEHTEQLLRRHVK